MKEPNSCGEYPYFSQVYPTQHTRWRSEGRFLFFCSESAGFGAFITSLVTAFVASVLSERALIIACSEKHEAEKLTALLPLYFNAVDFDWHWHGSQVELNRLQKAALSVPEGRLRFLGTLGAFGNLYNRTVVQGADMCARSYPEPDLMRYTAQPSVCPPPSTFHPPTSTRHLTLPSTSLYPSPPFTTTSFHPPPPSTLPHLPSITPRYVAICRSGSRPVFFHASEHSGAERMLQRGSKKQDNAAAFLRATGFDIVLPKQYGLALQASTRMRSSCGQLARMQP